MSETISFNRRKLPHWMVAERPYFVTFRQKGTLPAGVVEALKRERDALASSNASDDERTNLSLDQAERVDAILDRADTGMCNFATPECAEVILNAFSWMEEQLGWNVCALTVMSNHVHAVMRSSCGRNGMLNEDLGRLKGFTARKINKLQGRTGTMWQSENFDHWCRTPEEYEKYLSYTIQNPVRAGLVERPEDWAWTRT